MMPKVSSVHTMALGMGAGRDVGGRVPFLKARCEPVVLAFLWGAFIDRSQAAAGEGKGLNGRKGAGVKGKVTS